MCKKQLQNFCSSLHILTHLKILFCESFSAKFCDFNCLVYSVLCILFHNIIFSYTYILAYINMEYGSLISIWSFWVTMPECSCVLIFSQRVKYICKILLEQTRFDTFWKIYFVTVSACHCPIFIPMFTLFRAFYFIM
jgi:hypothetical protein